MFDKSETGSVAISGEAWHNCWGLNWSWLLIIRISPKDRFIFHIRSLEAWTFCWYFPLIDITCDLSAVSRCQPWFRVGVICFRLVWHFICFLRLLAKLACATNWLGPHNFGLHSVINTFIIVIHTLEKSLKTLEDLNQETISAMGKVEFDMPRC